jgi:hypothetical protein
MSDIEKHFTKINEALDTEFVSDVPVKVEENTSIEMSVDVDYSTVRNNLYNLVATGNDAVEHILSLAKASDSARSYEVVSQMLKTVAEINKDILDVHDKVKKIKEDKFNLTQKNTTNNTIYVGSTSELQDLINPSRSSGKNIKKV